MTNVIEPGVCHWCHEHCGGTCLQLTASTQMKPSDPAYWMLSDSHTSTPQVYRAGCYICDDKEFAAMGLPLCRPCPECMRNATNEGQMGHIAADDTKCDDCGYLLEPPMEAEEEVS